MSYLMELSKIVTGLAANAGAQIPVGLIDIWAETFQQDKYSIEQIRRAAGRIIREKTDFYGRLPTYAEFIEKINGNKNQLAEIEVQNVIKLIRSEGAYSEPDLKPAIKTVINSRFGGWKQMCGSLEESKLQWFIKEFKEAYLSQTNENLMLPDKEEAGRVLKQIEINKPAPYRALKINVA